MREYKETTKNIQRAKLLCDGARYSEALEICDKLIAEKHGNADVYFIVSSARIGQKQWPDAARAAEMALALAPDFREAGQNLYTARTAVNHGGNGKNQ